MSQKKALEFHLYYLTPTLASKILLTLAGSLSEDYLVLIYPLLALYKLLTQNDLTYAYLEIFWLNLRKKISFDVTKSARAAIILNSRSINIISKITCSFFLVLIIIYVYRENSQQSFFQRNFFQKFRFQ